MERLTERILSASASSGLKLSAVLGIALWFSAAICAQQSTQSVPTRTPTFERDRGPVVAIDEAHDNTHTYSSREMQGFVRLLQDDGYRVKPFTTPITKDSLKDVRVILIANPGGWASAYGSVNDPEITALLKWMREGGALVLIVGHMPFPMNAAKIIAGLGIKEWHNGYTAVDVMDSRPIGPIIYWRADSLPHDAPTIGSTGPGGGTGYQGRDAVLAKHLITDGRAANERVTRVATFGGSAFKVPHGWEKLLTMPKNAYSYMPPTTPNVIPVLTKDTSRSPVGGWLQGAVKKIGKGRVATFGNTALFSGGPAAENRKFLLNLMRWLSIGL